MKFIKFMFVPGCLVLLLFSCSNSKNSTLLLGEWKGVEWLSEGKPTNYGASGVYFNFTGDGRYVSVFGGDKEKGSYLVREDKLFTTPDDQLEIMVEISKLTKDSLVFNMNRGGRAETLTLIRK